MLIFKNPLKSLLRAGLWALPGLLVFALLPATVFSDPNIQIKKKFIHPLQEPIYISGSFAEYRSRGRFHFGLDYKTFNRVGLPIRMPRFGRVKVIQVGDRGYGNALFVNSGSHQFTFAHLQDFEGDRPGLEYLRIALYLLKSRRSLRVKIPKWFRLGQGELLARSGESGSGGPHLHFEVKQGRTYYNALSLPNLTIHDKTPPKLLNLYMEVNGQTLSFPLEKSGNEIQKTKTQGKEIKKSESQLYKIKTGTILPVIGPGTSVRFYVGAYDTMVAQNRNGVQRIMFYQDERRVFFRDLNRIKLGRGRQADKTYHPGRTWIGREYVYLLFAPGNKKGGGTVAWKNGKVELKARVEDSNGNAALLKFPLAFSKQATNLPDKNKSTNKVRKIVDKLAKYFSVIRRNKKTVKRVKNKGASLEFTFRKRTLHLDGKIALRPLKAIPMEKTSGPEEKHKGRKVYRQIGPAFYMHTRDFHYRKAARGKAEFPDPGNENVALYYYNVTNKRWGLLAFQKSRKWNGRRRHKKPRNGKVVYEFDFRRSGPIAQMLDISKPSIGKKFLWDRPAPESGKAREIFRQFQVLERGTGPDKKNFEVLLDGRSLPFIWIHDRRVIQLRIPTSLVPKRGALLSMRVRDFAGNTSPWKFEFIEKGVAH